MLMDWCLSPGCWLKRQGLVRPAWPPSREESFGMNAGSSSRGRRPGRWDGRRCRLGVRGPRGQTAVCVRRRARRRGRESRPDASIPRDPDRRPSTSDQTVNSADRLRLNMAVRDRRQAREASSRTPPASHSEHVDNRPLVGLLVGPACFPPGRPVVRDPMVPPVRSTPNSSMSPYAGVVEVLIPLRRVNLWPRPSTATAGCWPTPMGGRQRRRGLSSPRSHRVEVQYEWRKTLGADGLWSFGASSSVTMTSLPALGESMAKA